MSRDGLLPQAVSKVHPRFGTPYITTIITCVAVAIVAGLTQIQVVGEMTSIGTLFAFVVVCAAVLVLREALAQNTFEPATCLIGALAALVVGYAALALLVFVINRGRLFAFAPYCWFAGAVAMIFAG